MSVHPCVCVCTCVCVCVCACVRACVCVCMFGDKCDSIKRTTKTYTDWLHCSYPLNVPLDSADSMHTSMYQT